MPKKQKRRLYTFSQLDAMLNARGERAKHNEYACSVQIYGNVRARTDANSNQFPTNYIRLHYAGKRHKVAFADLYRVANGDTVYVVRGTGKSRGNTPDMWKNIRIWQKGVERFTPHDSKRRLAHDQFAGYLVRKGVATPLSPDALESRSGSLGQRQMHPKGVWRLCPSCTRPTPKHWTEAHEASLPKFASRCRRFASTLRRELSDGPVAVVQLLWRTETGGVGALNSDSRVYGLNGCLLHICLPPTSSQHGKRLVVLIATHSQESRKFFGVDGDYGIRHSQFIACDEEWVRRSDLLRWKSGKDAIIGIKEWVLGSIHIPGPS